MGSVEFNQLKELLAAREARRVEAPKRSAVAAVLRPRPTGTEVLLIKRAEHPDDPWSGHMAFPGGRYEDTDEDLLATAMRETREELALDLDSATLLGRLDDIQTHRPGLMVRPFVFALTGEPNLRPNREVAETLWSPLAPLHRGECDASYPVEYQGRVVDFPAFDIEGRIVWGLTYRMLRELFALL